MADIEDVAHELRLVIRRIVTQLREATPADDLPLPQRHLLVALDRLGPATTSDLARAEAVRSQSMGATVAAAEADGLVERRPHPTDGRRRVVAMTAAGAERLAASRAGRQEVLTDAMRQLSAAEVEVVRRAIPVLDRLAGR